MKPKFLLERKSIGECGEGWRQLIDPLLLELDRRGGEIYQIKEKFGGLRFYYGNSNQDEGFYQQVCKAEELSYKTCEECGEPGKLRGGGWVKTLCDKHDEEQNAKKML